MVIKIAPRWHRVNLTRCQSASRLRHRASTDPVTAFTEPHLIPAAGESIRKMVASPRSATARHMIAFRIRQFLDDMSSLSRTARHLASLDASRLASVVLVACVASSLIGCGGGDPGQVATNEVSTGEDVREVALALRRTTKAAAVQPVVGGSAPASSVSIAASPVAGASNLAESTIGNASTETLGATLYTGRAWHVDSTHGSDVAAGTAAAPWRTLKRASKQTLGQGDAVLLKCGGTWRESFSISPTNAPVGGAIVGAWGSCGTGNRPVITGADLISGLDWKMAEGFAGRPVYVASFKEPVSAVFWGGEQLVRARYPNRAGIGREFALIASMRGSTTLLTSPSDAALLGNVPLAGGKIIIRTNPWLVESHEIAKSDSSGAITLKGLANYVPSAGQGFFVEGKLALLDSAGEWFQDAGTGQLYVWTPSGVSPAAGNIEAVTRKTGITIINVSGVRVENIAFERQTMQSIRIADSPSSKIVSVSAQDAGTTGILIEGNTDVKSSGTSVESSTILNAATMGISATSPAVRLIGNQIKNTGVTPSGSGVSAGIYIRSMGGIVRDNRIHNSGFAGILLAYPGAIAVSANVIDRACSRFTDCGAIYAAGAPDSTQRATVSSNLVTNLIPNVEGAAGGSVSLVAGIYLDERSASVDVFNNMIERTRVGINIHNSAYNSIQSNHVWLAEDAAIRVHNSSINETVRGNVIKDNQLYASNHLSPALLPSIAPIPRVAYAQEWVHSRDATLMFSGANANESRGNIVGTMSDPLTIRWSMIGGWSHQELNSTQWSVFAIGDTTISAYVARPYIVSNADANLIEDGALRGTGAHWLFWSPTPSAGGSIRYNTCGNNSGCADFSPGSATDFLMSNLFRMSNTTNSQLYSLRVRTQAFSADSQLTMAINRIGGDWASLGLVVMNRAIDQSKETSIDVLFNATSEDTARLNITGSAGKPVRLLHVSLMRVNDYELLSPDRESTLLANEGSSAKFIDCPSTKLRTCVVSDLHGQKIDWPLILAPNSAKVVVSADGRWKL